MAIDQEAVERVKKALRKYRIPEEFSRRRTLSCSRDKVLVWEKKTGVFTLLELQVGSHTLHNSVLSGVAAGKPGEFLVGALYALPLMVEAELVAPDDYKEFRLWWELKELENERAHETIKLQRLAKKLGYRLEKE